MRLDDLQHELAQARAAAPPADAARGRVAVTRRVRRHRVNRAVAGGLAAAVVVTALVVVSRGREDASLDTVNSPPRAEYVVPSWLPDGLSGPVTFPGDDPGIATTRTMLVAPTSSADPVRDGFIVQLFTFRSTDQSLPSGEPVVQAVTADVRSVSRHLGGSTAAVVAARSTDDAWMRATVDRLRTEPAGDLDPASLPAGYEVRSTSLLSPYDFVGAGVAGVPGSTRLMWFGEPSGESLTVSTQRGTAVDLDIARWMLADARPVSVRGRPGFSGWVQTGVIVTSVGEAGVPTDPQTGGTLPPVASVTTSAVTRTEPGPRLEVIVWAESDHRVGVAVAHGYSAAVLQRVVDGLQPVGEQRWLDYLSTTTTNLPRPTVQPMTGGTLGSGTAVADPAPPTSTSETTPTSR